MYPIFINWVFKTIIFFSLGYQKRGDKIDTIPWKGSIRGACGQDCTTYFIPRDEKQSIYQLHNITGRSHEPKNIAFHEKRWFNHEISLYCYKKSQVEIAIGKHLLKIIYACGFCFLQSYFTFEDSIELPVFQRHKTLILLLTLIITCYYWWLLRICSILYLK